MTNKTIQIAPRDFAVTQSGPTSNPPSGGRWKWDSATQKWVPLDQPNTPQTQE